MTIKEQLTKIKENWLLLVAVLAVLVFMNVGNIPLITRNSGIQTMTASDLSYSPGFSKSGYGGIPNVPVQNDFAPEVKDRKITKSSSISIETPTGSFSDAESKLKLIVTSTGSYLLNENANRYDSGWKSYYSGSYQIKVDSRKYNSIIAQLKNIGEVKSFNENSEDITGSYKNLEIELNAEKQRLLRYNKMYDEATLISDKILLSDKIFDQERTIKYLEDSLKNTDQLIEYSTIYVSLNEKQSGYANIAFVKFSELVSRLVGSINGLLTLIFVVLPYAVAGFIIWIVVRFFRNRR